MAPIQIGDESLPLNEWAERSGIPLATLQDRIKQGYTGQGILIPTKVWWSLPQMAEAQAKDQYEAAIRKMIVAPIPQFRFNILVELCREVGLGVFQKSALRRNISRGNHGFAVKLNSEGHPEPGSLASYVGPQGTRRGSWMINAADRVRRWGDPRET